MRKEKDLLQEKLNKFCEWFNSLNDNEQLKIMEFITGLSNALIISEENKKYIQI